MSFNAENGFLSEDAKLSLKCMFVACASASALAEEQHWVLQGYHSCHLLAAVHRGVGEVFRLHSSF